MMSSTLSRPVRTDLGLFAIATAVLTGAPFLILLLTGWDVRSGPGLWVFGVGTSGPSLAALIVFLVWSRRRRRVPRRRVAAPWLWLPAALVLGILPTVIANLLIDPASITAAAIHAPEVLASFGGGLLFVVLFLIAGPIAEEFGWRGFVQPRLRLHWTPIRTAVVLGSVWALWHIPLYFLPGTGQYQTGLFTLGGLTFVLSCVPMSLVYLFVSERLGGQVWAAILIHFAANAIGAFFPSEDPAVLITQLVVAVALAGLVLLAWGPGRGAAHPAEAGSGDGPDVSRGVGSRQAATAA
ncbi:type II CAAX endopeptidase family protein [Microbacterium sp.]|uniref:type II CAAX endopeptidase family protein n=1 Tax=Microbacterium sp. TaxID=51671 RepID=UPI002811CA69|nr:type II CAAX endopeptidase family protein [Microbacterium sp.]